MDLIDLVHLAQNYTWLMVLLVWLTVLAGGILARHWAKNTTEEIEDLAKGQDELAQDVHRVDMKQDHIVKRQEVVLDRIGVNSEEIQELQRETTRLDAEMPDDDRFYRGSSESGDD